jgi:hypothetical protein
VENRAAMLRDLRQHLQGPVAPVLVGDFNCVISQADTEDQAFIAFVSFPKSFLTLLVIFSTLMLFVSCFLLKSSSLGIVGANPPPV